MSADPSPQRQVYLVRLPVGASELAPVTVIAEPTLPQYGPPAFATGPTVYGADDDSPAALYAATTIV